ncbi:MAG: hypothetical protein ABSD03_01925 [Vulcanimicrobiaceae bacterium]|jgi:hypothetical protein
MRFAFIAFFAVGSFVVPSFSVAQATTITINPSITKVTNANGTSVIASPNPAGTGWRVTGCPVTISFSALATLSDWPAKTLFTYKQYRSDGGTGPTWSVLPPTVQIRTVTWTWTLGANGAFAVELKPVSPPSGSVVHYTRAPFRLTCPRVDGGRVIPGNFQDDASGWGVAGPPNIPPF